MCLQLYYRWGDSARLLVEDIPDDEEGEEGGSGGSGLGGARLTAYHTRSQLQQLRTFLDPVRRRVSLN